MMIDLFVTATEFVVIFDISKLPLSQSSEKKSSSNNNYIVHMRQGILTSSYSIFRDENGGFSYITKYLVKLKLWLHIFK